LALPEGVDEGGFGSVGGMGEEGVGAEGFAGEGGAFGGGEDGAVARGFEEEGVDADGSGGVVLGKRVVRCCGKGGLKGM
jgi:hypothetical protein